MNKLSIFVLTVFLAAPIAAQVRIYDAQNQSGPSAALREGVVYQSNNIPNNLNNRVSSVDIPFGYQVVISDNSDGTGKSRVYIAATERLRLNVQSDLNNRSSFIRVLPFRNHIKKGLATSDPVQLRRVNAGWYYHWVPVSPSTTDKSFVPMAWGINAARNKVDDMIRTGQPTMLAFNEPDPCDKQSGVALCEIGDAIQNYRSLMRAGMRMGSPAVTQGQWNKWLLRFMRRAYDENLRVDFIAVHWYDWSGWANGNNRSEDPSEIAARFIRDMNRIHDLYKLPIVLTEFNANPNRFRNVQDRFLQEVIPWLETTRWIEGYSVFQSNKAQDHRFIDASGNFRANGLTFHNAESGPHLRRSHRGKSNLTVGRP